MARLGIIKTAHGVLRTPAFFPVATQAALKTLTSEDIKTIGYEGILCNTYHLSLRPGGALIKKMGGLHKFMNFPGVIITDSGGFQAFSLGQGIEHGVGKIAKTFPQRNTQKVNNELSSLLTKKRKSYVKIREDGVYFRSHIDGAEHFLNPEKSISIQQDLGSDIMFVLDECTSPLAGFDYTKKAMERTHRWALRCLETAKSPNPKTEIRNQKKTLIPKIKNYEGFEQGLFGIVQGGEYRKLREQSAKFISGIEFDGFGIGGSLGKTKDKMYDILDWTIPLLPPEKPRHLLGIGYLEDFKGAIKKGIDLFDCVYPTRFARHGIAMTNHGTLNFAKIKMLVDKKPIDKTCQCPVCQNYSRSYICHLFRAKEITAMRLITYHNLYFFKTFLETIRQEIESGKI